MPTTKLVLLRHGESVWNREGRFTGWVDVRLSERGHEEARAGARAIRDEKLDFDVVHTSRLTRAISTMTTALDELDRLWLDVRRTWRLNERHYGALQGLNKKQTTERHGEAQVHEWRRSYDVRPPAMKEEDPGHPRLDPRYRDLPPDVLPSTECLKDVVERMLPYWYDAIVPDLKAGRRVLVVAHGNSLRALVKHLDRIPDEEIADLNIPTGIPLLYELDRDFQPLGHRYLGDPEEARRRAAEVAAQARA